MVDRLKISANRRFLVTRQDTPFFWLADTAWELFHRLSREEADHYLETRLQQGFNVVLAVILAEMDGLHTANANGDTPLIDNDPLRPNEAYFAYVDEIIELAAAKGIYIGLLPTWGDKVDQQWGVGPVIFDADNIWSYGEYLGERYRHLNNIVWVLGGDRKGDETEEIWHSLAQGIRDGGARQLMTYHPQGKHSSAEWFHEANWLDFNMLQTSHKRDVPVWEKIAADYNRQPVKPVLDGEPCYEDMPNNFSFTKPYSLSDLLNDYDIRRVMYRGVFAGGFGATYGHHSVWQMARADQPVLDEAIPWQHALDSLAADQMGYIRRLLESRPFLNRIPDQKVLASHPGDNAHYVCATRADNGSYAMIYIPTCRQTISVNLRKLVGDWVRVWWFEPATGRTLMINDLPNRGNMRDFTSPKEGEDWVLVLDNSVEDFPAPGDVSRNAIIPR
jgi:hypothetical protein